MIEKPRYDRDKLVDLLAERATFEKTAVGLYDALLEALVDVDDDEVAASIGELRRHREEERQHAMWLDGLLHQLGGRPAHALPAAVSREARALEDVIRGKRNGAGLLPMFHAMLAAELMDAEGWKLLLEIAESMGDRSAVRELRMRVAVEDEHLALIRRLILTLAKESVQLHGGAMMHEPRMRERQRRQDVLDVDVSGPARATTDHEKIRRWAEERGGKPARVRGTGRNGDIGMIRIDFPGWSGERSLEAVDWGSWFRAFDDNDLALVYEERTATGQPSRFNKLVARDTVRRRQAGEYDASAHKGRRAPQRSRRPQPRRASLGR